MKRIGGTILGTLAFAYLRFCFLTSRFVFTESADRSMRASWESGVATVFICWHDEFLLSLLSMQTERFRRILFITNDSFGGVFLETFCRWLGLRFHVIRRRTPRLERLRAMADGLAQQGALAIAADYGPPWYRARPTACQLARATQGVVVACRIEPRCKLRVRMGGRRAYLPVPFTRYELTTSAPLRAPRFGDASAAAGSGAAGGVDVWAEVPGEREMLDLELNRLRQSAAPPRSPAPPVPPRPGGGTSARPQPKRPQARDDPPLGPAP